MKTEKPSNFSIFAIFLGPVKLAIIYFIIYYLYYIERDVNLVLGKKFLGLDKE